MKESLVDERESERARIEPIVHSLRRMIFLLLFRCDAISAPALRSSIDAYTYTSYENGSYIQPADTRRIGKTMFTLAPFGR